MVEQDQQQVAGMPPVEKAGTAAQNKPEKEAPSKGPHPMEGVIGQVSVPRAIGPTSWDVFSDLQGLLAAIKELRVSGCGAGRDLLVIPSGWLGPALVIHLSMGPLPSCLSVPLSAVSPYASWVCHVAATDLRGVLLCQEASLCSSHMLCDHQNSSAERMWVEGYTQTEQRKG